MFSAERILAIRKSKGLSQELLAEQSGVSLRTIQRVEQGETVPRGHTMQALAHALEVSLDTLLTAPAPVAGLVAVPAPAVPAGPAAWLLPEPPASASSQVPADPQLLQMMNLSALCLLVFPFLNLVVPYLLWRKHRHDSAQAAEVGRRVFGFQVLWQVASFVAYLLAFLVRALALYGFGVELKGIFLGVFGLTYVVNIGVVVYNQALLRRGRLDIYPIRL